MRFALVIGLLAACGPRTPKGAVGASWGESTSAVATRLGVTCEMHDENPFQMCWGGPIAAFDRHPRVTLVSEQGKLAGVRLQFSGADCHHEQLQQAIGKELDVEYTLGAKASPYTVYGNDELVYFNDCELVVAGSRYGKYFVNALMTRGLGGVINSMTPH